MVISYLIVSSVSQLRVTKKSILSQLGVTRKSLLSLFSSFGKEVVADRGGRRNNVYTYFFVNDRIMHSPTTSPYWYSSFPKEENRVTIAYNYSLELLFHIEAGTGFHVFIG